MRAAATGIASRPTARRRPRCRDGRPGGSGASPRCHKGVNPHTAGPKWSTSRSTAGAAWCGSPRPALAVKRSGATGPIPTLRLPVGPGDVAGPGWGRRDSGTAERRGRRPWACGASSDRSGVASAGVGLAAASSTWWPGGCWSSVSVAFTERSFRTECAECNWCNKRAHSVVFSVDCCVPMHTGGQLLLWR